MTRELRSTFDCGTEEERAFLSPVGVEMRDLRALDRRDLDLGRGENRCRGADRQSIEIVELEVRLALATEECQDRRLERRVRSESRAEDCTAKAVKPGERCTVTIAFRPVSAGGAAAELVVDSDANSGAARVALAGEGLAGRLVSEPERLRFDPVHRGASAEKSVQLRNRGTASFAIAGVKIAGAAEAEYVLVNDRCSGDSISPGSQCDLDIRFLPGREGKRLAFLVVDHDAIEGASEIALSGEGLPPVPTIRIDPASMDFGTLDPGDIGSIQTVTIRNPGLGPLQIRDISIVGRGTRRVSSRTGDLLGGTALGPA